MYFTVSQMQYFALAVFGGLILLLIIGVAYWSFRLGLRAPAEPGSEREKQEGDAHEFNDGLLEGSRPIPLFTILVFFSVLLWGVMYIIAIIGGWIHVQ